MTVQATVKSALFNTTWSPLLGRRGQRYGGITIPALNGSWNPLDKTSNVDLTASDRAASLTGGGVVPSFVRSTDIGITGKKYFEIYLTDRGSGSFYFGGIALGSDYFTFGSRSISDTNYEAVIFHSGQVTVNTAYVADTGFTFVTGDTLMVAVDLTAQTIWFGRNGTWYGNPAAGTGGSGISSMAPTTTLHKIGRGAIVQQSNQTLPTTNTYPPPSGFTSV